MIYRATLAAGNPLSAWRFAAHPDGIQGRGSGLAARFVPRGGLPPERFFEEAAPRPRYTAEDGLASLPAGCQAVMQGGEPFAGRSRQTGSAGAESGRVGPSPSGSSRPGAEPRARSWLSGLRTAPRTRLRPVSCYPPARRCCKASAGIAQCPGRRSARTMPAPASPCRSTAPRSSTRCGAGSSAPAGGCSAS